MLDLAWFERRLRRFSRVRRHLLNAALGYRLATIAALIGIVGLIVLSGWLPGPILNLGLCAIAVAWLVGLAVKYLVRRARFRSCLDEAFRLEQLAGGLNSRVVSAWDFLSLGALQPLTEVVVREARRDLEQPVERMLDRQDRDLFRRWFAFASLVLLGVALSPWFGWWKTAENLVRSWRDAEDWLFPVEYTLEPRSDREIRRLGEAVEFKLQFARRSFESVTLVRRQGEETSDEPLTVEPDGVVRYRLTSPVEAEFAVQFAFGKRQTKPIHCVFTTAPTLVNMQTEIVAPGYAGQLPRSLEGIQQRLLGLPGTRLTLGFTFSKELESASIEWDDGQTLPLEVVGRYASVGLVHSQARQARVQVRDIHGLTLDDPLLIDFDLQVDEKPQVLLPKHLKDDMPLLADAVPLFGFGVRATDDYGITRCLLKWQKSSVDSPASVQDQGEVERLISPSQRTAVVNFEKVFEGSSLKPGDKITFEVEATDNRTPDKQITRSRRYSFFVYQEDLGKLSIAQLGFGAARELTEGRIGKSQKATAVKSPDGLRTRELVQNEFDAEVATSTQAPTVRGEFGRATQDYFRVLSGAK